MEQARVLQRRAKARVAEVKIRDEGLQAKKALLQTIAKSKMMCCRRKAVGSLFCMRISRGSAPRLKLSAAVSAK
jgi:hypothetical protein